MIHYKTFFLNLGMTGCSAGNRIIANGLKEITKNAPIKIGFVGDIIGRVTGYTVGDHIEVTCSIEMSSLGKIPFDFFEVVPGITIHKHVPNGRGEDGEGRDITEFTISELGLVPNLSYNSTELQLLN